MIIIRVVSRLVLLLATLALATALIVGALSMLANTAPAAAAPLLERDHVSAVERTLDRPTEAKQASDASATPAIVLVFAGIVVLATLPPVQRVHVYHRSYQRSDWI